MTQWGSMWKRQDEMRKDTWNPDGNIWEYEPENLGSLDSTETSLPEENCISMPGVPVNVPPKVDSSQDEDTHHTHA